MTVNLSALGGAGQQFFDNNGVILSGGKLYSYAAGTTTPQTTYTTAAGNVAHTNPIILDSAGRVATGEIWLTAGSNYKFVLKTSADVTLATWDNITGIDGTGIAANAANVIYDPAGAVPSTVEDALRTVEDELNDIVLNAKRYGAVGDGVTDDTVALQTAINETAAAGRTLVIQGTPLCSSQITVPDGANIEFEGAPGNRAGRLPASYLIKKSTVSGALLVVVGESVSLKNGGVVGRSGNTGDNIQIIGHSVRWEHGFSTGAGRDGVRVGEDGGVVPNSNMFRLIGFSSCGNTRDGYRIEDNINPVGGSPNANAGVLLSCFGDSNGGYGCYGGNSFGNTIESCLFQSNGAQGLYLNPLAVGWNIIGGDVEANSGGSSATGADIWLEDTDIACTFQDSGDTVTKSAHGLSNGTPIRFARILQTTGINESSTTYYVVNATTNTFQVATSAGGSAVALTTDGTGIYYRLTTHQTRGGHKIIGTSVGRVPYDGSYQTDQQWVLGQGFGASSGLRPGYNEVTFTPTLEGSTTVGSATLSSAVGRAIKIGRMVTVIFNVTVSSFSGATGTLRIGGLPFKAASGLPAGFSAGLVQYLTMPTNRPVLGCGANGWYLDLYGYGSTSATQFIAIDAAAQTGNFTTAGRISGSFTYMSAD